MADHDYALKEKWYDTSAFGGHANAARIVADNGSAGFDIERFIDSPMGEKIMSIIENEFVNYGPGQWHHPEMIRYWADRGVCKTIHNLEDSKHVWISYVPDNLPQNGSARLPVVFCAHGGGGTLFEAENHGFVALCREQGFMVIAPEHENSDPIYTADHLPSFLDEIELSGYPIDRTRIYLAGMSQGGVAAMYAGLKNSGLVAAVAAHSCPGVIDKESGRYPGLIPDKIFTESAVLPLWLAVGEYDFGQLPLNAGTVAGLNLWLDMNECPPFTFSDDNLTGIAGHRTWRENRFGITFTHVDAVDERGIRLVEIIGIEGHPHWVSPSFGEEAWAFLKRFSRINGELIFSGE